MSFIKCVLVLQTLKKVVKDFEDTIVSHDTVIDELREMVVKQDIESAYMAIAAYMHGFWNL